MTEITIEDGAATDESFGLRRRQFAEGSAELADRRYRRVGLKEARAVLITTAERKQELDRNNFV